MSYKKLIEAQKEYIKFLGDELSKHEAFIVVRPYMAPSEEIIEKGSWLRNMISELEKKINNEQN